MADEDKKEISLSDLSGGAKQPGVPNMPRRLPRFGPGSAVREVNVAEVTQPKKEEDPKLNVPKVIRKAIEDIPKAVQRLESESAAIIQQGQEMRAEEELDADVDDGTEVDFPTNTPSAPTPKNIVRQSFDESDDLFDDEDEDEEYDFDFPSNNNKVERTITMENNNTNANAPVKSPDDYKAGIDKILHDDEIKEQKIEFPAPSEEDKEKLAEVAKKTYEEVIGTEEEDDDDGKEKNVEDDTPTTKKETTTAPTEVVQSNGKEVAISMISDDDLALLDDDDDLVERSDKAKLNESQIEELKADLRKNVSEVFVPVKNKVNLSEYTIQKKPISASKVLNHIQQTSVMSAAGVLYNLKKVIEVSEFSSMEIQNMDPSRIRDNNYYVALRDQYRTLYNHIIDPNKPATFEAWLKLTYQDSIPDYFFTAYKATFGAANIITYNCPECDNIFLKEVPVMDMIKYKNDDVKKEYLDILHHGQLNVSEDTYPVGLYQVNDEYVFGLKHPTLYEQILEPTLLDTAFVDKYSQMLTLISYIDSIFVIDAKNKNLIPVDMKSDPRNPAKTTKRRIKICGSIISSLTSDQLQSLSTETDKYDRTVSKQNLSDEELEKEDIAYIYPACTCPKCGKPVSETEISPNNMLFTRHQLGAYQRV